MQPQEINGADIESVDLNEIGINFLPEPEELIDYLLIKCGFQFPNGLNILLDIQNIEGKTSLLYCIMDLKEGGFNITQTTDEIMEGYIREQLLNYPEKIQMALDFYIKI